MGKHKQPNYALVKGKRRTLVMRAFMARKWRWIRASRVRRITAGTLATFLVAGTAFAFYVGVLNDGTGSATYPGTFGANSAGSATFTISQNTGVTPYYNNTGLQPSTTECYRTTGGQYQANASCGPFNLMANMGQTTQNGSILSITLTGITVPQGCPEDSVRIVWPDGNWSGFDDNGNPIGTDPNGTYTYPGTGLGFNAGDQNVEMFPNGNNGGITQSDQPLIWFYDDGANQDACAGDGGHGSGDTTGQLTLSFSAHATYS